MTEAKRAITALTESQLRPLRRDLQMIFQDPFASLNPLHRIVAIVGDPLLVHGERDPSVRRRPVAEMLDRVVFPQASPTVSRADCPVVSGNASGSPGL